MLNPVIDVAIGLILTFLLLGLIASALQEIVAGAMQWRGKALQQGLRALLVSEGAAGLFEKVYRHPMVSYQPAAGRLPSYLSAKNFAIALTESLLDGTSGTAMGQIEQSVAKLPDGAPKAALQSLLRQASGNYDVLKAHVEEWYDDAMDRVSGLYKRRSQVFSLLFGVGVAIVLNVDSIDITRALWIDPQKRALVVQSAQLYLAEVQRAYPQEKRQGDGNGPTHAAEAQSSDTQRTVQEEGRSSTPPQWKQQLQQKPATQRL